MRTLLLPSLLLLATANLAAQGGPTHLVGLTAQMPAVVTRDQSICVDGFCQPLGFPQTVGLPYLGGTGWDPVQSGSWISNGPSIACVDRNCNYLCPIGPVATPGLVTGLEVVESLNEIWATDSLGSIVRMTRTCPPAYISSCVTGVPVTPTRGLSGIAVDEGRQLVFYCGGDWVLGTSRVWVSLMGSPCTPFHNQPVTSFCSPVVLRVLTGLAVDWGNQVLYMTDGFHTIGWSYVYNPAGPSITFAPASCCFTTIGDSLVGLAVQTNPAVPLGGPCANGSCPACPMVHTLAGDPNLGNGAFGLRLTGAPAGSTQFAALKIGTCVAPGTFIAGLCGPVWMLPPLWGTLGPNFVGGFGCTGVTVFGFPLPPVPAVAGMPIASQCLGICPGGGTTMSNCLSWVLQGN